MFLMDPYQSLGLVSGCSELVRVVSAPWNYKFCSKDAVSEMKYNRILGTRRFHLEKLTLQLHFALPPWVSK